MKKLFFALLGIVVLLMIVVFVGPSLIDLRSRISAAVYEATGRHLRIEGALHLSLFPKLSVAASNIHLSNAPDMAASDMVSIENIDVQVELWPLLQKRLVIDSLVIDRPTIDLEVDKKGRPNWVFWPSGKSGVSRGNERPEAARSGVLGGVRFGNVRVEHGHMSYRNDLTGQTMDAKDISGVAAMAELESPLAVQGRMTLNNEPVKAEFFVDTLGRLQRGQQAGIKLSLETKDATVRFGGTARERPVPGLNGVFDLDVPSVGKLASWLKRPLSKGQPDPGSLKVHAVFASDGAESVLKEATIVGTALNAKASGSIDWSGGSTRVTAAVESGVLDIDRYLPRQVLERTAPQMRAGAVGWPAFHPRNSFSALYNQPFNLAPLRKLDADIKVSVAGIKAMGYDIGRIACTATAKDGLVNVNLAEIALYGGKVTGTLKLDGVANSLAVDAAINIDHVAAGKFVRHVAAGWPEVAGAVTVRLGAQAQGTSPRALAEDVHGHLAVDLGGLAMKKAGSHAITQLKLNLDVPGGDQRPGLTASAFYNGEHIEADASLAPLRTIASGERFPASLAMNSKLVTLQYAGTVWRKPILGLDGTFDLDVPSVVKLAAWASEPLSITRPDPGPLKIHAMFSSDGAKVAIREAAITGKAIKATAQAQIDVGHEPATFSVNVDVRRADLNIYLLPHPETSGAAKLAPPPRQAASWTTSAFDLTPLNYANGRARVSLAGVRYRNFNITKGDIILELANRVLRVTAKNLALGQGTANSAMTLYTSNGRVKFSSQTAVVGVQLRPLLEAFAGSGPVSGSIALETTIKGEGKNEKELISSLAGAGRFKITDGAIYGINLARALRKVGTLGFGASKTEKTDFAELSGSYTVKSGVIDNRDMKMLAPLVRLTGGGTVPLPTRTVDYAVEAKLVPTIQGQGGRDSLAGLPIPIKVTGPWSGLSYKVDWAAVFREMAADPDRLKSLPGNVSKAAKGLGIPLSIPGGMDTGSSRNILKQIPGLHQAPATLPSAPSNTKKPSPVLPFGLPPGLLGK